jgi:peptidyl-tRNA hydrolase
LARVLLSGAKIMETIVTKTIGKSNGNYQINRESILLVFDELDAAIARSWLNVDDSDNKIDELLHKISVNCDA